MTAAGPAADSASIVPQPPVGLYVHIPFCHSICPYCDFVVYAGRDARGPASQVALTTRALMCELELRADGLDAAFGPPGHRPPLASVYLGGGTPSLLPAPDVARLLERVATQFGLAPDAEVTLEANPGPDDRGDLAGFRAAGVTRLSLGAQSLSSEELRRLGRRHTPADVAGAVTQARAAGFASISLDLLSDLPDQQPPDWRRTLDAAVALGPDHLSTYALTLELPESPTDGLPGAEPDHLPPRPGARRWRARARSRQDEDRAVDMDAITDELLGAAGYERYELSNHARPGHQSRHNRAYWERRPVSAIGPGAHAFDGGLTRTWNTARLDRYVDALLPADGSRARLPSGGVDLLDPATARTEVAILGLRLGEGLAAEVVDGAVPAPVVAWAVEAGLATWSDGRLRLTPRGRLLSNEVFARLLPAGSPDGGHDASALPALGASS